MSEKISTGYKPRQLQHDLHLAMKRFNVLVCHRRFGKTVFIINHMLDQGLRNPLKNPQYAYFAPFYAQAKRVAWDYFKEFTKDIPGRTVNEAELRIDIPRSGSKDRVRFMLLGADNPGAIRGIYLDGAALDEYAEMDPTIWGQVIRPALSDRLGWATFIGTPKGQNHFYDIYQTSLVNPKDWHSVVYKASQTGVVLLSELEAAKATMSAEEYEQEFECSFSAALVGAYYGKHMEKLQETGRITTVDYDPSVLVTTAWDLGIGDSTAIWFYQRVGRESHLIDYLEDSGQSLDWYVGKLKEKPYLYGEDILPHDARARSLETGRTREETLRKLGRKVRVLPRQAIDDGINAARMLLPGCWFDAKKCSRGIAALNNYQRKWDAKNKIFSARPKHDWASHGADAFRALAMGLRADFGGDDERSLPRQAVMDYDVFGGF